MLLLVDAASLYFRAYFGVPESAATAPDGTPVNAVRGFLDMVSSLIRTRRPGRLLCALDADWRPAWRVALLPAYKAHRLTPAGGEEVPDALERQVPIDTAMSAHMANIELHRVGAAMLSDIVGRIAAGRPLLERSPGVLPERLNYYPNRAALDAFAERGLKLVDMAAYDGLIREFLPEIRTGGWI